MIYKCAATKCISDYLKQKKIHIYFLKHEQLFSNQTQKTSQKNFCTLPTLFHFILNQTILLILHLTQNIDAKEKEK